MSLHVQVIEYSCVLVGNILNKQKYLQKYNKSHFENVVNKIITILMLCRIQFLQFLRLTPHYHINAVSYSVLAILETNSTLP